MTSQPAPPPTPDEEQQFQQISAYLDGELAPDEAREIESRLASDANFRTAMQSMQQSWELLDELPRTEVDQRFTASTVEMVAVQASGGDVGQQSWAARMSRQWALVGLSVLAACLIGFLVTTGTGGLLRAGAVTDPNDQLLTDLPILLNLDPYLVVEDLDYLRSLNQLPATLLDLSDRPGRRGAATLATGSTDQRRGRIEAMTPAERKALAVNQERFQQLSDEDREHLRRFHEDLVRDPAAAELLRKLDHYYQWYKSLPPEQRVELRVGPIGQRLVDVQRLRAVQVKQLERERIEHDLRALIEWMEVKAERHQRELLAAVPTARVRPLTAANEGLRRRQLLVLLWQRWQPPRGAVDPPIDASELRRLLGALSPQTRDSLDPRAPPPRVFSQLVERLVGDFQAARAEPIDGPAADRSTLAAAHQLPRLAALLEQDRVDRERLMRFYREELSPQQRDRYMRLPRDEFLTKLRQQYLHQRSGRFGQHPPGPPHDRHGGPSADRAAGRRPPHRRAGGRHEEIDAWQRAAPRDLRDHVVPDGDALRRDDLDPRDGTQPPPGGRR